MTKCSKCGTEFEGKFCPECGNRAHGQKTCPECGATIGESAKFCNECGYSFESGKAIIIEKPSVKPARVEKQRPRFASGAVRKTYTVLGYVAVVWFVLFAAMALGFCSAPIALVNSIFGGAAESLGNAYSQYDGILLHLPELKSEINAIVVIVALQAVTAVIAVFLRFFPRTRDVEIMHLRIPMHAFAAYISVAFYIMLMIVSAVITERITALDEGAGLLIVGAGPKLLLAFSIVSVVFAVGAGTARVLIGKSYPELPSEESADRAERRKKYAPKFTISPGEVKNIPILHYVEQNVRLSRAMNAVLCLSAAAMLVCLGLLAQLLGGDYRIVSPVISPHWIVITAITLEAIAIIVSYAMPVKGFSIEGFAEKVGRKKPKKSDKGAKIIVRHVLYFILWFVYTIVAAFGSWAYFTPLRAYIIFAAYALLVGVGLLFTSNAIDKRNSLLAKHFFGTVAPLKTDAPIVEYDAESEIASLEKYKAAVKQKCAPATDESEAKYIKHRRVKISVAAVSVVVFAVAAAISMPLSIDKFSASYVGSMPMTDNVLQTEFMFGKADEVTETKLDPAEYGSGAVRITYEHFGDEFKKLYTKLKELEGKLKKVVEAGELEETAKYTEQCANLELQLKSLRHDYLKIVTIMTDNGSYTDEIVLEKGRCLSRRTEKKTVEKVEISQRKFLLYENIFGLNVYYKCYYTDGSYKYSRVPTESLEKDIMSRTGKKTLSWSDEWGDYSADADIVNKISGTAFDININFNMGYSLTVDESESTIEKPVMRLSLFDYKEKFLYDYITSDFYANSAWDKYAQYIASVKFDAGVSIEVIWSILDYYDSIEYAEVSSGHPECSTLDGALYNKDGTELIIVPRGYVQSDFVVPTTVKKISECAFCGKEVIEDGITYHTSNIENIIIPESVVEIDDEAIDAFSGFNIYAQAKSMPGGWNGMEYRRVVFGSSIVKHNHAFESNGGSAVSTVCGVYAVEEFPIPKKAGFIFGGWYDNAALDGAPLSLPYSSDRDMTLYAKWTSKEEYDGTGVAPWSAVKIEKKEIHQDYRGNVYYTGAYIGSSYDIPSCWYVYSSDYDGMLSIDIDNFDAVIYEVSEDGELENIGGMGCQVKSGEIYYINVMPNSHVTFVFRPTIQTE